MRPTVSAFDPGGGLDGKDFWTMNNLKGKQWTGETWIGYIILFNYTKYGV